MQCEGDIFVLFRTTFILLNSDITPMSHYQPFSICDKLGEIKFPSDELDLVTRVRPRTELKTDMLIRSDKEINDNLEITNLFIKREPVDVKFTRHLEDSWWHPSDKTSVIID